MNGANADPCVNVMSAPKSTIKIMMGINHHFFLTFRKSQNSRTISNFAMHVS